MCCFLSVYATMWLENIFFFHMVYRLNKLIIFMGIHVCKQILTFNPFWFFLLNCLFTISSLLLYIFSSIIIHWKGWLGAWEMENSLVNSLGIFYLRTACIAMQLFINGTAFANCCLRGDSRFFQTQSTQISK